MPRLWPAWVIAGSAVATAVAGPTEAVIVAAMRLAEQPNYSWTAIVADDARTYDIVGQTSREGYSRVTMPVINSVRRRLGRSVTDTQIELIFRGNVSCVVSTEQGWLRPEELPPPAESGSEAPANGPLSTRDPLPPSSADGSAPTTSLPGLPLPPSRGDGGRLRPYSNLQLAVSLPHEELAIIVGCQADLQVEGDVARGTLTDLGAKLLLVRDGQREVTPVEAAGTFTLWLAGGGVSKYQVRLAGLLRVSTPAGVRSIRVTQTTDTLLRHLGTTNFEVPEEARRKLAPTGSR